MSTSQFPGVWPVATTLDSNFHQHVTNFQQFQLANGLTVFIFSDPQDRSCKLELFVNGGAIHQPVSNRGIAHFTEHMVFRSTQKFADNEKLMQYAQDFNIEFNGYTSKDMQAFYCTSDADLEAAEAAANLLSQIVLHPKLEEKYINLERDIVYSEQQAGESDPDLVTNDEYERHFHSAQHPLGGGGLIGEPEVIKQYNHQQVIDFYSTYFSPKNMVLVISGGLADAELRKLAEKYFDVSREGIWQANPLVDKSRDTQIEDRQRQAQFNHINVVTNRYLTTDRIEFPSLEYFALRLAQHALSTRVFLDIREKQGLAYAVYADFDDLRHGFVFQLHGEFPQDKHQQGKDELIKYMDDLINRPMSKAEFQRALRNRKSVRWADRTRAVAEFVARNYFVRGQLISPEMMRDWYNQLDLDFVNESLASLLKDVPIETIEVGPLGN